MSIFEEIKDLQEKFEGLFITETSTKKAQAALDAAKQRYNRKSYEASLKLLQGDSNGAIEDGNQAQDEYNKHLNLQLKRAKRTGEKLVQDKNDHDSFVITKESFQDQIAELTEAYQSLLEEIPVEKQDISPNKIKRKKKDEEGEPVEVVSVADELFPYKGTAKEQYNQKIIAKINDMIEGTATLDDLIQLVRQKKPITVKESLEEAIFTMEELLEAIKDNVRYLHKGADGSAIFDYKGNRYQYGPKFGEEGYVDKKMELKKVGAVSNSDNDGPVTKALKQANQNFDNARTKKNELRRLSRKANIKLNKLVKKFEKENGKGTFPGKTTPEIKKAAETAGNMSNKWLEADKKFTEINNQQKKDGESGLVGGLKYEGSDIYRTKKGDSFGVKPVVKKS